MKYSEHFKVYLKKGGFYVLKKYLGSLCEA